VANPIYHEAIIRSLASSYERRFNDSYSEAKSNKWIDGDKLEMTILLKSFQEYWRENSKVIPAITG
jgi:hypothetical protein